MNSVGEASGGANVSIGQVHAKNYSDFGVQARNSTLSIGGGHLISDQAEYGIDLEHDVVANLQNLTVKGHRGADIRYGSGVTADLHNVTTRDIYDRARRRSKVCGTKARPQDLLLESTERQRQREARLHQMLKRGTVASGAYTLADIIGL